MINHHHYHQQKSVVNNLVMCIHSVAICTALEKHSTDREGMEGELH